MLLGSSSVRISFAGGGKLTGVSAGGHMLFYCEPKKQKAVKNKMKRLGLKYVDFKFHQNGPKIIISDLI